MALCCHVALCPVYVSRPAGRSCRCCWCAGAGAGRRLRRWRGRRRARGEGATRAAEGAAARAEGGHSTLTAKDTLGITQTRTLGAQHWFSGLCRSVIQTLLCPRSVMMTYRHEVSWLADAASLLGQEVAGPRTDGRGQGGAAGAVEPGGGRLQRLGLHHLNHMRTTKREGQREGLV